MVHLTSLKKWFEFECLYTCIYSKLKNINTNSAKIKEHIYINIMFNQNKFETIIKVKIAKM